MLDMPAGRRAKGAATLSPSSSAENHSSASRVDCKRLVRPAQQAMRYRSDATRASSRGKRDDVDEIQRLAEQLP